MTKCSQSWPTLFEIFYSLWVTSHSPSPAVVFPIVTLNWFIIATMPPVTETSGRACPKTAATPTRLQVNTQAPQATQGAQGAQHAPRAPQAPQVKVGDGAPNMMQAVAAVVQGIQQGIGGALVEAMQGVREEIKSSLAALNLEQGFQGYFYFF